MLGVVLQARRRATSASRPALKIIALLQARGADVRYHDPYVPELPALGLSTAPSWTTALEGVDLAVIVTAHPGVDHEAVVARAPRVVDFRGVTRKMPRVAHVEQL